MIQRFTLTSALTLGSIVAFASTAVAQSVDINFSGTVQGKCNFGTPTGGTLVTDGPPGAPGAPALSSAFPGGAPGQVTVTCNQPAELVISGPTQTAGPSGGIAGAVVQSPQKSIGSGAPVPPFGGAPGGTLGLPPGVTPLTIHMGVQAQGFPGLLPGNYNYKVTLTIIP